jgi:hypothetical protein
MIKLKKKIISLISIIDSKLTKNKSIFNNLVSITDKLSKFTHFCFFDIRGLLPLIGFLAVFTFFRSEKLELVFEAIKMYGFSREVIVIAYQKFITFDMILVLCFYILLIEIVFICTLLINIPCINLKLKEIYGEDIIKMRGYNAIGSTLTRAMALLGGTILTCFGLHTNQRNNEVAAIATHNRLEGELAERQNRPPTYQSFPLVERRSTVATTVGVDLQARLSAAQEATGSANPSGNIFQNKQN